MLVFEAITEKSRDLTNHLLDHSKTYPKFSFKEAETVKESSQAQHLRYKIFKKELKVTTKLKGQVGWFDEKKGFGVIIYKDDETTKEYFAHHSEINVNKNVEINRIDI